MANDLVPIHSRKDAPNTGEQADWDLPPKLSGTPAAASGEPAARRADRQAGVAQRLGDTAFASVRQVDARENRQSRWDWGDGRTWLWIFAMFAFGIAIALAAYAMPQGKQAAQPAIHVY